MLTNDNSKLVVVTGAGGFIGGSLVSALRSHGYKKIRAVDVKPFDEWYQRFDDVENLRLDLNLQENCETASRDAADIYNFAANMGGMGFIEHNKALCMLSVLINTQMLQAALKYGVKRFFFSSSACVYNAEKQKTFQMYKRSRKRMPIPLFPEDGYGWEKIFSSACAATSARISASYTRSRAFTTSMVPGELGMEDGRRLPRPFAEK